MIESVDAFYDHEPAFRRYLQEHDMDVTTAALGLRRREAHTIHPKVRYECGSNVVTLNKYSSALRYHPGPD